MIPKPAVHRECSLRTVLPSPPECQDDALLLHRAALPDETVGSHDQTTTCAQTLGFQWE